MQAHVPREEYTIDASGCRRLRNLLNFTVILFQRRQ